MSRFFASTATSRLTRMGYRLAVILLLLGTSIASAQTWPAGVQTTSASASQAPPSFAASNEVDFMPVDRAFQAYAWRDESRVYIGMRAQPGHYLYRHRFALESADTSEALTPLDMPAGEFKHDPYLGDVYVFHERVTFSAPLPSGTDLAGDAPLPLTLSFQGCAEAGLCYPPEHWRLNARPGVAPEAFNDASDEARASPIAPSGAYADPFSQAAVTDALADPIATPAVSAIGGPTASGVIPDGQPTTAASVATDTDAPPTAGRETPPAATLDTTAAAAPFSVASDDSRFRSLLSQGLSPAALALFFLAGLGLTFTPCVLPMVPILTSIIVGQQARPRRALALSASYVAGMALTFAVLGTLMGLFGASLNLQARLQSPWVLAPLALLFVVFAVAMFGAFELRLPQGLSQRADRWQQRLQRSGPLGLAATGALSVLVVSPCVSAPLAGALVFISATGDAVSGASALLALALGMGLPLILVGTFGGGWLPRAGAWMNGVKAGFGVMLLGVAIWLVERLLPGPLVMLMWAALALGCAAFLGALDLAARGLWPRLRQTLGWLLLVWGVALTWGAAQGGDDPLRPLTRPLIGGDAALPDIATSPRFEHVTDDAALEAALARARAAGKPVMVDVSADWCISCKIMEREVFPAPAVAQRLAHFTLIRADVTDDVPESRALLERRDLFGPPGLLFFTRGAELRAARIQGEVDAEALVAHLDAVLTFAADPMAADPMNDR